VPIGGAVRARIVPDGAGGALVVWQGYEELFDPERGCTPCNWYRDRVQWIDTAGTLRWGSDGLILEVRGIPEGDPYGPGLLEPPYWVLPDGQGGTLAISHEPDFGTVTARHVTAEGVLGESHPVAEGASSDAMADGAGGAFVVLRTGAGSDTAIVVQRLGADGSPVWPGSGLLLCAAAEGSDCPRLAPDGAGGAMVVWLDRGGETAEVSGEPVGPTFMAQRVSPEGAVLWSGEGIPVCAQGSNPKTLAVAPDGSGGLLVAWQEHGAGVDDFIVAQRFTASGSIAPGWSTDGVTATELALVEARAEAGLVRLTWLGPAGAALEPTLYRREVGSDWIPLARLAPDGSRRFAFEDRGVSPGGRYGYRLGVLGADGERFYGEVWVDVPSQAALRLEGLRPHPATRQLNVAFSLPGPGKVTIELIDTGGRRALKRVVEGLGPGPQVVPLGEAESLRPGVYLLRLIHGGRSLTAKACLLR
jgi:hypothetical protein